MTTCVPVASAAAVRIAAPLPRLTGWVCTDTRGSSSAASSVGGAVRAAVVDDDQLDVARVGHVEHPLDDDLDGLGLVEDRHEDRQLHCAYPPGWPRRRGSRRCRLEAVLAASTAGSQPSAVRASVMSGCRTVGSSCGRGTNSIGEAEPTASRISSASSQHRELARVADVDRPGEVGGGEPEDAVDQVVDVADAAGLRAVAGHRDRLAGQRLPDEGRDGPAVVRPHPRPVRVEDPHDAGVDPVGAPVGHGQRLGEPLGLVVHAARADRVDVPPVGLRLRVHLRVAVRLRGGGQHVAGALLPGQAERVQRADRADLHRVDRQPQVVHRRGRRGEVQHQVDVAGDVHVVGDVGLHQPERADADQVRDVARVAGDEVVQAEHVPAVVQQPLAQVRAEEPGTAGHHRPLPPHRHRCLRSLRLPCCYPGGPGEA